MRLIAVDPGGEKKGNAYAVFYDDMLMLAEAGAWLHMADEICDTLVVEKPVVSYGRAVNANDLIEVAMGAGAAVGSIVHDELVLVTPQRWKGSRPKAVDIRYTKSILSSSELTKVPPGSPDDVWDAIGIGLWATKRRK